MKRAQTVRLLNPCFRFPAGFGRELEGVHALLLRHRLANVPFGRRARGSACDGATRMAVLPAAELSIEAFLGLPHRVCVRGLAEPAKRLAWRDVLNRGGDPPDVAERVADPASPLPERLGQGRSDDRGAGSYRGCCRGVGVRNEYPRQSGQMRPAFSLIEGEQHLVTE